MEKVFVKERTVYISQDFMLKMVHVKMDISKRYQKQKIVPMIHTYINGVMQQELNAFVCTPYDTRMLHARLNAVYKKYKERQKPTYIKGF